VGSSAKITCGRVIRGSCDRDPLLLAAGELAGTVCEALGQAEGFDDLRQHRAVRLAARELKRQQDVLLGSEGGKQVEGLEHEPDLVAADLGDRPLRQPGEVLLPHPHRSAGGTV